MSGIESDPLDKAGKRRLCKAWAYYNECRRNAANENVPPELQAASRASNPWLACSRLAMRLHLPCCSTHTC